MSAILNSAIQCVQTSEAAWCRFITANDAGATGSHQAGVYIPKCSAKLLFDEPCVKGENREKLVKIIWQNDFVTDSCMKYYGQGTRNEYRITRFGRGFPLLREDNVGDLLIIVKLNEDNYAGFVLETDDDIDGFFSYFNLSPSNLNKLIDAKGVNTPERQEDILLTDFVAHFDDFPSTAIMSEGARHCCNRAYGFSGDTIVNHPDEILMRWLATEYELFKKFEKKMYADMLGAPFGCVDAFVEAANLVLNRRKSRAGKSLEHHLANIFSCNQLAYEEQVVTENNKKPDFVFPNGKCYHDFLFEAGNLTVLGVKTTCKDRWRQILSEADRVDVKYLFTTQAALSKNQLAEMRAANVELVVPREFIPNFPIEYRSGIHNLHSFINVVREKQSHIPNHYLM